MNSDMNTLELAKLYESQGYNDKAHEIYSALELKEPSKEVTEGLERTQNVLSSNSVHSSTQEDRDPKTIDAKSFSGREKMASLLEQWIKLLVVKQRLDKFKRIKARLS